MAKWKDFVIPALSAVMGGLLVIGFLKLSPRTAEQLIRPSEPRSDFNILEPGHDTALQPPHETPPGETEEETLDPFHGFMRDFDPIREMERMQKMLGSGLQIQTFAHTGGDIETREDQNFIYFDVKVGDPSATEIRTKVENGYLTITGESKSNKGDDDSWIKSSFTSRFTRSFPLPENVDPDRMEMVQEQDKIVIKFPKVKA